MAPEINVNALMGRTQELTVGNIIRNAWDAELMAFNIN